MSVFTLGSSCHEKETFSSAPGTSLTFKSCSGDQASCWCLWRHVISNSLLHECVHAWIFLPRDRTSFSSAPGTSLTLKIRACSWNSLAFETHAECLPPRIHMHVQHDLKFKTRKTQQVQQNHAMERQTCGTISTANTTPLRGFNEERGKKQAYGMRHSYHVKARNARVSACHGQDLYPGQGVHGQEQAYACDIRTKARDGRVGACHDTTCVPRDHATSNTLQANLPNG